MATEVRRADDRRRYELVEDGRVIGIADYRADDDVVELPHTVIEPTRRGEGLAAVLVRAALDDIRPSGRRVVPSCWYVADFIEANPDYRDLLT
jgi:hypothetical protein